MLSVRCTRQIEPIRSIILGLPVGVVREFDIRGVILSSASITSPMSSKYESHFETIRDRSIVISDLIEQILLVEEVIVRHQQAGTTGVELEQYVERRAEYQASLNEQLENYRFRLVRSGEAA